MQSLHKKQDQQHSERQEIRSDQVKKQRQVTWVSWNILLRSLSNNMYQQTVCWVYYRLYFKCCKQILLTWNATQKLCHSIVNFCVMYISLYKKCGVNSSAIVLHK